MKKGELNKGKYDFAIKYTDTNFITRRIIDNFYNKIKRLVQGIEVNSILEVGCGPGYSTQYLSKIFKNKIFEASDYDMKLVKDAKKKNPDLNIVQESIYGLKRKDESFDLVVALEILEHLEFPEKAMQELMRVTRKYCLISVPREPIWRILNMSRGAFWGSLGNTPGHINHWSKKVFIDFVDEYFKVEKIKTPLPWTVILGKK